MQNKAKKAAWISAMVILLIIVADQALKIHIKTSFYLGEQLDITSWFKLLYVQNPGMAFGWSLGNKLILTLLRLGATVFGFWYLSRIIKRAKLSIGLCISVSLILAGAIGNLIDCMFYGVIFDNPLPPETATLFPESGGYAPLFHGQVVDMLYFPLFSFYWPDWMPLIGGNYFEFFHPIFNIADSAVSVGVMMIIFFYSRHLSLKTEEESTKEIADTK